MGDFKERVTEEVNLLNDGVGMSAKLRIHKYGPASEDVELCYIQASLHADELPGILVSHHLLKILDFAASQGWITKRIHIVPYANPFGLYQQVMGDVQGRFNIATGTNFNRGFKDQTRSILDDGALEAKLVKGDGALNARAVKAEIKRKLEALLANPYCTTEEYFKLNLLLRGSQANITLDLHCDCNAQLHLYCHKGLWEGIKGSEPSCIMQELAAELQASPVLISTGVGNECAFDDVCSNIFYELNKTIGEPTGCPIAMGCESCTVELRGSADVSDEFALKDARAIFNFLQRRGYITCSGITIPPTPEQSNRGWDYSGYGEANIPSTAPSLLRDATELAACDMIPATAGGIVNWNVGLGAWVKTGDILGEIINVEVRF